MSADPVTEKARLVLAKLDSACDLLGEMQVIYPNEKLLTALALIWASVSDARSIALLIGNHSPDLDGSAFSLLRPMTEKLKRGAWLGLCATEEQVHRFLRDDIIPGNRDLTEQLEAIEPFDQFQFFSNQYEQDGENLHNYTHGGNQVAIGNLLSNQIGTAYPPNQLIAALQRSDIGGTTAAFTALWCYKNCNLEDGERLLDLFGRQLGIPQQIEEGQQAN